MTKSIALVAFSVMMGVVAILGMTTDLSGRLKHAFSASSANAHLSVGTKADFSKNQSLTAPNSMYPQSKNSYHDCDSENYNPLDD